MCLVYHALFHHSHYIGNFIHTYTSKSFFFFLDVLEPRVSLEAASLSLGIGVRCAYIPPSSDPTNSYAICGILLGMIDWLVDILEICSYVYVLYFYNF
ncbi:hypothetical protein Hanom_Chr09g00821601 [Helianthus anomalus]